MPMQRRLPKFGFHNPFRVSYNVFNLDTLQAISEKHNISEIDPEFLISHRLISKNDSLVKILGDGELKSKLTVKAHKFSKSAEEAIQKAGGEAVTLEQ
jgi:large subunit ribosomal protein L15